MLNRGRVGGSSKVTARILKNHLDMTQASIVLGGGGGKRHSNIEIANLQLNIQVDNEHIKVCNDRTDCFASTCVIDNEQLKFLW